MNLLKIQTLFDCQKYLQVNGRFKTHLRQLSFEYAEIDIFF